jgi:AcrR family transcriptional regulator
VILRASLDVADELGLGAVTMQAVAGRLGVTPMALYRHIANKADLLDAVQESLLLEFSVPDERLPWRARLAGIARAARESARRHPEVFPLLLQRAVGTPGGQRVREAIYAALRDAGVPDAQVPRVERLLSTFVMGFAISEASGRFAARGIEVEADFTYAQNVVFELIERARGALTPAAGPDRARRPARRRPSR